MHFRGGVGGEAGISGSDSSEPKDDDVGINKLRDWSGGDGSSVCARVL